MGPEYVHDSFYRFVAIDDPHSLASQIRGACKDREIFGTVLVAGEGINSMLSGTVAAMVSMREWFANDERFANLFVKSTACELQVFKRLKVKVKQELVPLRIDGIDASKGGGRAVSPREWTTLLDRSDVVLLDNRNSFEFAHGHFRSAIDPGVGRYTNFSDYVDANIDSWAGKTVAMYCTGGIRCEKTAAWLATRGLQVLHLEGGIVKYFQDIQEASDHFEGKCFVFDERITIAPQRAPLRSDATIADPSDTRLT